MARPAYLRSFVGVAALAGVLGATAAAGGPSSEGGATATSIPWERSFPEAMRRARAAHKPVMVDFWAGWCHWCHELDATTYRDPKVVELAREFVAIKVDTEGSLGGAELAERYGATILPTVGFLSPTGRLFLRRTSFEGPDRFPSTLEAARRLATDVAAWEAALDRNANDPEALAGLGSLLADQGLLAESRELLARARKLDDARPGAERKHTRRTLALAERQRGKGQDAERLLEEALAIQPAQPDEDATTLLALGKSYSERGEPGKAAAAWRRTAVVAPGSAAAEQAVQALERLPPR